MKKLFAICFAGMLGFSSMVKAQDLTLEDYFTPVTAEAATPDNDGFIRRWMLLEPISKPNRGNTVFTDSYVRHAFDTVYYKNQKTMLPKDGQKVQVIVPIEKPLDPSMFRPGRDFKPEPPTMTKMKLAWHALDSKRFNVKLYRFATGLKLQRYGVIFHAVTIIDCEEDIENVRLAVGSNSASMWWLNDEEALILSGDRRMVQDDCVSKRVTLKKGRNVLRGAVINGPGMSDFCVRFISADGKPVTSGIRIN